MTPSLSNRRTLGPCGATWSRWHARAPGYNWREPSGNDRVSRGSKPLGERCVRVPLAVLKGESGAAIALLATLSCNLPTGATYDGVTGVPEFDGGAGGPVTITIDLNQGAWPSGGAGGSGGTGGASASAIGGMGTGGASAASVTGGSTGAPQTLVALSSAFCGDGVRDPVKEECDDGPPVTLVGVSDSGEFCSEYCQVTDARALADGVADSPRASIGRRLGAGRHPTAASASGFAVALVQEGPEPSTASVRVVRFDAVGHRLGIVEASADTLVQASDADPVVALTPGGDGVVVYTDFGGDGDGKGIAARVIRAGKTIPEKVRHVSEQVFGAQYAPDVLALPDRLVIAWSDAAVAATAPDLRYREFSFDLEPLGEEKTLSSVGNVQGRVALAPLGMSFGAAWRSSNGEGLESTEVFDGATGARFTVPAHLPASAEEVPALLEINATHRVLVLTAGVNRSEPGDAGVGDVYTNELFAAVLDTSAPGTVLAQPVPVTSAYQAYTSLARRRPALVRTQSEAYLAWGSGAPFGSSAGEDVWLERLTASIAGGTLSLTFGGEWRLPRWASELNADQRFAALVIGGATEQNPGGSLFAAWDDHSGALSGASHPDVVAQLSPLPLVRQSTLATHCTQSAPCSEGQGSCSASEQCVVGLVCNTNIGPQFDYGMGMGVCVKPHCANGVKDQDEAGPDCGGVDCGTCTCGDGVYSPLLGEACDEGAQSASCELNCRAPACGDGITNPQVGEACDDGNSVNDDACTNGCALPRCGDGIRQGTEQCDDGNTDDGDGCSNLCRLPMCGDGVRQGSEACDDGNGSNTDACVHPCATASCGDRFVWQGHEECDPGIDSTCNSDCTANKGCLTGGTCLSVWAQGRQTANDNLISLDLHVKNNGTVAVALNSLKLRYWFTPEGTAALQSFCDFATLGCSRVTRTLSAVSPVKRGATHQLQLGLTGTGNLAVGAETVIQLRITKQDNSNFDDLDDFSFPGTAAMVAAANIALYRNNSLVWGNEPHSVPFCGDGIADYGDVCDTTVESGSCNANCTPAQCGDSVLNVSAGEICDTGGNSPTCDSNCTTPGCNDGIWNPRANEVCDPSVTSGCRGDCTGWQSAGTACMQSSLCLHVQHRYEDSLTDQSIRPVLRIVNSGSVPVRMRDITLRYWFTGDGGSSSYATYCDNANFSSSGTTNQCSLVTRSVSAVSPARPNADRVYQLTFNSDTELLPGASTGDIIVRTNKSDWSNFNESNDWSQTLSSTFTPSTHTTLLINGVLMWGQEP